MFAEMPLVVSLRLTFTNLIVIGGEHDRVDVTLSVPSALPFWTGKSPADATCSLLTAFGWLLPPLMHSAVALSTTWTCGSLPSPASLKVAVRVLPVRDADAVTKCGLPANAPDATTASAAQTMKNNEAMRFMNPPWL